MQAAVVASRWIALNGRLGRGRITSATQRSTSKEVFGRPNPNAFSSSPVMATWAYGMNESETEEQIEYITSQSIAEAMPTRVKAHRVPWRTWEDGSLDRVFPVNSWLNDYEVTVRGLDQQDYQNLEISSADLLRNFDPENPPAKDQLVDLELWLECEAQQEAMQKYIDSIENARKRKDYSSLSLVQKQILWWFQPLVDAIQKRQKDYLFRDKKDKAEKGAMRFGPFICTLPPEKLAVITAHTAIMESLSTVHGDSKGIPFITVAKQIGKAVEDEVIIQRLLYKRFKEAQAESRVMNVEDLVDSTEAVPESNEEALDGTATSVSETEAKTEDSTPKWSYSTSHLDNYLSELKDIKPKSQRLASFAIWRARNILENEDAWSEREKIHLGAVLFHALLDSAKVKDGKKSGAPAFRYYQKFSSDSKSRAFVEMDERLRDMVVSEKLQSIAPFTTRQKPMVLPPKPWTKPDDGGYLWLKSDVVRYHDCEMQKEALRHADLSTVYDGLNSLSRVPWVINRRILDVAQRCWNTKISIGDVPSQNDFELPPEPVKPERPSKRLEKGTPAYDSYMQELRAYRDAKAKYDRLRQKNADLVSLRCSALLKLNQAESFKDYNQIYFPYNMDFRGRSYPCTPHLSIVGSDLCRGLLKFAEAKPLGPRGLFWLKVHLANLAGVDKCSFEERAQFIDKNMDKVRASAENTFGDEGWWRTLDDPFQGLAVCDEIIAAIDSGAPENYMSSLAVHMDGTCNGLQHYAALGRDSHGGKAVNLCNSNEPQDVYSGVMVEVIRRVAEEASKSVDFETDDVDSLSQKQKKILRINRAARLVDGLIDRGVVKRTVMTSVYGITYIGARQQIQEKIEEKLEARGHDLDELRSEIFAACGYLARVTMEVMGQVFTGAEETKNWLTTCARLITQHGYPVAWVSPIGLPTIQPYRQKKTARIVTLMQVVTLIERDDDLPLHKPRQVSAFPPNFVHSLDASHMLLTALEMDRRGLAFSAVHDSFWTHPCDIDEMNEALRDTFVDLYDRPLLEQQLEDWKLRYPDLEFPPLPKRGDLDLSEVRNATYFFQ